MDSLQKVMQRMSAIEQRFARMPSAAPGTFAAAVQAAEKNYRPTASAAPAGDIENIIGAAARKYQVDPKLALAVATAESGLQPQAVSPAGAMGVMQLMPETARNLGVGNPYDPGENIDGGVRYLKQLLSTFGGDTVKAVAAYNAGPEAVRQYNGVPPYSETREYVNKVLNLSR